MAPSAGRPGTRRVCSVCICLLLAGVVLVGAVFDYEAVINKFIYVDDLRQAYTDAKWLARGWVSAQTSSHNPYDVIYPSGSASTVRYESDEEEQWPTLFLIGVEKGATSSLYDLLIRHPKLCAAATGSDEKARQGAQRIDFEKEVHYFDFLDRYKRGTPFYLSHFGHDHNCDNGHSKTPLSRYVDATPTYLIHPLAANRLVSEVPWGLEPRLRVLVVLREPIDRDFSMYRMKVRDGSLGWTARTHYKGVYVDGMSYCEVSRASLALENTGRRSWLARGHYASHLDRWFRVLKRNQFLVISFDMLINDTPRVMAQVARFLGLSSPPSEQLGWVKLPYRNPSPAARAGGKHVSRVDCSVFCRLHAHFAPRNEALYRLFDKVGWDDTFVKFDYGPALKRCGCGPGARRNESRWREGEPSCFDGDEAVGEDLAFWRRHEL